MEVKRSQLQNLIIYIGDVFWNYSWLLFNVPYKIS